MQWSELFSDGHEPSANQIKEFVGTSLWDDLTGYLQNRYNVQPKLFYSCCSMEKGFWKGWNVKYKKGGKSLCTLYPKKGYFVALIPLSVKEITAADLLILQCDKYTQKLYRRIEFGKGGGKSLPVEVTSENILHDVKELIALRAGPRKT